LTARERLSTLCFELIHSMKFAFSTLNEPGMDFDALATTAKDLGFDGLELRAPPENPGDVARLLAAKGIEIACLASSLVMSQSRRERAAVSEELRRWLDTADLLSCRRVKILDVRAHPGQPAISAAVELAGWLLPLADYAARRDVTIVVENALSFRTAKEMWMLLESIHHPNVAACWDVFNATQAGESPFVSVPTLNSRIQYARVREVRVTPAGLEYCALGEGSIPVRSFLSRLRGIGYGGYVTLESPPELLADSIRQLREWEAEHQARTTTGASSIKA
jgi:fatty-acyl-CoA synthase